MVMVVRLPEIDVVTVEAGKMVVLVTSMVWTKGQQVSTADYVPSTLLTACLCGGL